MSNSSMKQLTPHPEYYIKGGDIYIVVAHTLFRVHSYFFQRESQRFQDIMAAPVPAGQVRQGEADHAAIMVKDVSVDHFAKFLWVFYNPLYTDYTATLPEWIAILKLSHEYQFPEVKRLAIHELQKFDIQLSERIVLYQNHAVDAAYLVPLYVKLCMREEWPTDEEIKIMGMETSVIIYRARERLRGRSPSGCKNVSSPDENDISQTIYSWLGFNGTSQSSQGNHADNKGRANKNATKGGTSSKFN